MQMPVDSGFVSFVPALPGSTHGECPHVFSFYEKVHSLLPEVGLTRAIPISLVSQLTKKNFWFSFCSQDLPLGIKHSMLS